MTTAFKVESGLQLLARLSKKKDIHNFYPILFENGPKVGEVVEIFGESGTGKTLMLMDLIIQALLPEQLGGTETEVIVFNTDGNMSTNFMLTLLEGAIRRHVETDEVFNDKSDLINEIFQGCCNRFHYIEIYDATQLYITIQNLDNIFIDNPNISLLIFDTLTAYYWSEQGNKLTKMDLYLKNILKLVQKATREYKITIVYTRPEYFNSSKESIENLDAYCALPTLECLNYRIYTYVENSCHWVFIRSDESSRKVSFQIKNNCQLEWL